MKKGLMVCYFCKWYVKNKSWIGRNGLVKQKGFCLLSRIRWMWRRDFQRAQYLRCGREYR